MKVVKQKERNDDEIASETALVFALGIALVFALVFVLGILNKLTKQESVQPTKKDMAGKISWR